VPPAFKIWLPHPLPIMCRQVLLRSKANEEIAYFKEVETTLASLIALTKGKATNMALPHIARLIYPRSARCQKP